MQKRSEGRNRWQDVGPNWQRRAWRGLDAAAVLILLVQCGQSRIVVESLVELDVLLQRQLLVLQARAQKQAQNKEATTNNSRM